MILNFDGLFCIPPHKELLLVAMEMILMMLNKKLVNRLLMLSIEIQHFKKCPSVNKTIMNYTFHSAMVAENVSFLVNIPFPLPPLEKGCYLFKVMALVSAGWSSYLNSG